MSSFSESLLYETIGGCWCIFIIGSDDNTIGFFVVVVVNIHFKGSRIGPGVGRGKLIIVYINFEAPNPLLGLETSSFLLRFFRRKA